MRAGLSVWWATAKRMCVRIPSPRVASLGPTLGGMRTEKLQSVSMGRERDLGGFVSLGGASKWATSRSAPSGAPVPG